jgi:hypothetical protein
VRAEYTRRIGTVEQAAARARTMAISGTTPEPPATSSTGPPSAGSHTKCPPIGPRTSSSSPTATPPFR